MLDRLILEGEKFESQAVEISYGTDKMISGLKFETWVSKVIFYMEQYHESSSLTKKAVEVNKDLTNGSYQKYHFLLGTLIAVKDIEAELAESMQAIYDLNN